MGFLLNNKKNNLLQYLMSGPQRNRFDLGDFERI